MLPAFEEFRVLLLLPKPLRFALLDSWRLYRGLNSYQYHFEVYLRYIWYYSFIRDQDYGTILLAILEAQAVALRHGITFFRRSNCPHKWHETLLGTAAGAESLEQRVVNTAQYMADTSKSLKFRQPTNTPTQSSEQCVTVCGDGL